MSVHPGPEASADAATREPDSPRAPHTPGPWVFSFEAADPEWAIVTTPGGSVLANVNADHRQEANARLIAAAPDLLAFCLELEDQAVRGHAGLHHTLAATLRTAIAKATGQ